MNFTKLAASAAAAALLSGSAFAVLAPGSVASTSLFGSDVQRAILSSDLPGNLVDANTSSSAFSGVVSLNIRFDIGGANYASYICSGALLDDWHVMTAGHCIDSNDNGLVIDLTGNNDVRGRSSIRTALPMPWFLLRRPSCNPDYDGFDNCPGGGTGCLNDDIAIIRLGQAAPTSAARYSIWGGALTEGQEITMVGYGLSGDGRNEDTVNPSFTTKRVSSNVTDLFDLDDEQGFAAGAAEVWYADFDGTDYRNQFQDTFCQIGLACTAHPGANEGAIGGGDSGGPSFVKIGDQYFLAGNNTFSGRWPDQVGVAPTAPISVA